MRDTGKRYFEVKSGGHFGKGDVARVSIMGKGRNAKVVVSGGGRIIATPLIRAQHGSLKEARSPHKLQWSIPTGFKAWG